MSDEKPTPAEVLKQYSTLTLVTVEIPRGGNSGHRRFARYDATLLAVEEWQVTLQRPQERLGILWHSDIEACFFVSWSFAEETARPDVRVLRVSS